MSSALLALLILLFDGVVVDEDGVVVEGLVVVEGVVVVDDFRDLAAEEEVVLLLLFVLSFNVSVDNNAAPAAFVLTSTTGDGDFFAPDTAS